MADPQKLYFMGGGVAAHVYSLVAAEVLGAKNLHITMRDLDHNLSEKTLCVWGDPSTPIRDAVVAEWSMLRFGYGNGTFVRDLGRLRYSQYTAASLRALTDTRIEIERVIGDASMPDPLSTVSLDSRPNMQERRPASVSLLQHFHGWRVTTAAPIFEDGIATMMDFRVDQSDGVCFVYVLPYSTTEALVECTVFSAQTWPQQEYEVRLRAYLTDILHVDDYRIIATETGAIPMCDRIPERRRGESWIAIGAAAGLTKPTTGYTVARCVRDAKAMLNRYSQTGVFESPAPSPRRFDWYDRLLLRIIRDEPDVVPQILWTLFERNPIERILRFLDEETDLREELLIFWSLPWLPFLRAIGRR
jgi:hypothetical protein